MGKRLEVWDKKAYDKSISATKEEKVQLAKRVMLGEKPTGDVS
jgi:MraZ protein